MNLNEALNILEENGYKVIKEGIVGKTLAAGALAAGLAFGNSGVKERPVTDPELNFGKNSEVHIQDRHDLKSTKYGVPTTFKLDNGESPFTMEHRDEVELTMKKILATPDSMLKDYGKTHTQEIANLMVRTANKYNIDIDILLAIAGTESNFDSAAKSGKDAKGIMQITDIAAFDSHTRLQGKDKKTYRMSDYTGLSANIDNAGRIIADLSVRRNNVIEMILASYNGGTAQATQYRYYLQGKENTLSNETKNYVKKCMMLYHIYKDIE